MSDFKKNLGKKMSEILDYYEDYIEADDLSVKIQLTRADGITSVTSTGYIGEADFEFHPPAYFEDPSNKRKKPKSFQQVLDAINGHISP